MHNTHINAHQLGIFILCAVVLPLLDSSVKRKAAEIDGEKVQIEKYVPFDKSCISLLVS